MAEPSIEAAEDEVEKRPKKDLTDGFSLQSHENSEKKNNSSDGGEHPYVTGFKLATVMTSVTMVAFLFMLDTAIISTAVPKITSEFHSLPDVGWYGSSYLLACASLQPLTGKLYTHFKSKYTFLAFLGIFELGSLLCGVAQSSKMLIVGRAVAGLGAAGIVNGALTILSACVPLYKRPLYLGVMMSVSQIGTVLGPLIGGALTQYTTWRWCFYINLPPGGAVAVLLSLIEIPDQVPEGEDKLSLLATLKKLDLPGFVIFAPAAIQCLLALQWGGSHNPWGSATIIGLFCGSAGTFCVFLAWEYRSGDQAMIPLSMLRQRVLWSSCLVMAFFFGSVLIAAYYLPIYFQAVRDATPTLSGVYLLPLILTQMVFATFSGFLVGKLGYYLPWILTSGVLASIGTGLFGTFTTTTDAGKWIGYQILAGVGRGCGIQMPIIAIQNTLPPATAPIGLALIIFAQTFGGAVLIALAETGFSSSLRKALAHFAPTVDAQRVVTAGARGFRDVVTNDELEGVLKAYNEAVRSPFYLAAGAAVGVFLFGCGMGWKKVSKEKKAAGEGSA